MVRDIDKLRARAEFRLGPRHLALIVCATAVAGGSLFAVANALAGGRAIGPGEAKPDPLAMLDPAEGPKPLRAVPAPAKRQPEIEPLELSFHERLGRPATSEEAPPSPVGSGLDEAMAPLSADEPVMPAATVPPPATLVMPATGGPQHNMPLVVSVSPAQAPESHAPPTTVASPIAPVPPQAVPATPDTQPLPPGSPQPAFDEEPTPDLAQPGERGVFTLQVASYDDQNDAVAFMNMLRQRGHQSFLVRADGGDRGIIWRVRVGPFDSQPAAERYRRRFERTERIPTFVVRRRLPP